MKKTLLFLLCALLSGLAAFGSIVAIQSYKYTNEFVIEPNKDYFDTQEYAQFSNYYRYDILNSQFRPQFNADHEITYYKFEPVEVGTPFYYEIIDTEKDEVLVQNQYEFNRRYSVDEMKDVTVFDFKEDTMNGINDSYVEELGHDNLKIIVGRPIDSFSYQISAFNLIKSLQGYSWMIWLWVGVVIFGIILLIYHYQTAQVNWITKIPTEILIVIIGLMLAFGVFGTRIPLYFVGYRASSINNFFSLFEIILLSISVVGLLSIITFAIMMILTKIKTGRLFKDSLIHKGVTGSVSLFGLMKNQTQILFGIIAVALVHLFVLFVARNTLLAFLLFCIDLVVVYFILKIVQQNDMIYDHIENIRDGNFEKQLEKETFSPIFHKKIDDINNLHEGINKQVEKSLKEERMSIDLITNVSHDLKTPLTSILNYTQMILDNENPEKHREYLQIIKEKALRLSELSNDVVEASKASSGKLEVDLRSINVLELINMVLVEHQEGFEHKGLSVLIDEEGLNTDVLADSQRLYRVFENLFKNIEKYALDNTRVYIQKSEENEFVHIEFKNVSSTQLGSQDLTARFVQGDTSRSEGGSGLGLAIAKDLMKLQQGNLELLVDGDLFKVILSLKKV